MNVGELFVTLGVNAETFKVKDFARAIGDLPLDVAGAIASLAGIDFELLQITKNAFAAAASFQMFGEETGLSWEELQKWQIVAQQANVSTEAVANSVSSLQKNLAMVRLGQGNIAPYQLLGINVNQDAFQVLSQLREKIKSINPALATNLVSQMGIDPSMIHLLHMSNEEFAKLSKTVRGMTGEEQGSFLRAKQQIDQFGLVMKYHAMDSVAHLIWLLETMYEKIKKVQGAFEAIGIALAAVALYFAPVTAAVIGLLLILDDLVTYFEGGDSITGLIVNGIKKIADELGPLASKFAWVSGLASLLPSLTMGTLGVAPGANMAQTIMQTINMSIHSTAPAHDVAKHAVNELNRTATQINQHGG